MPRLSLPIAIALALALAPAARAAHFDFVYTDQFDLTLCANGCGITLAGTGYALLANKGSTDIDAAEVFGAKFVCTSSRPDFQLSAFVNNPMNPVIPPIHPGEIVGSVSPYDNDAVLLSQILPGETYRNTYEAQFMAFEVTRLSGDYEGPVQFDVTMTMGGESAKFTMNANTHLGAHAIWFTSAARTTSSPQLPTAARRTSWGALKSLYR